MSPVKPGCPAHEGRGGRTGGEHEGPGGDGGGRAESEERERIGLAVNGIPAPLGSCEHVIAVVL